MALGKLDRHAQKKKRELDHSVTPPTRLNPKRMRDRHARPEAAKPLERNGQQSLQLHSQWSPSDVSPGARGRHSEQSDCVPLDSSAGEPPTG